MDREQELAVIRRAYAKRILAGAEVKDTRVLETFAQVRREHFLGPGPWPIAVWDGYRMTPDDDPVYLYDDILVGLVQERRLNNGGPALHALLAARAAVQAGDHVVHIGTGVGYYTAILAHLAGPSGRTTGIEFDPDLAARATANFADDRAVTIVNGDGAAHDFDVADVIYVNAGTTHPLNHWLDRLAPGGRLLLPMTTKKGFQHMAPRLAERHGAVFLITRDDDGDDFAAQWISPVAIIPGEGALRDPDAEAALTDAFTAGGWREVCRLVRRNDVPDAQRWLTGPDWCFTRPAP